MREFKTFHPFITLYYFVIVIFFTMFQTHPIFLAISMVMAILLSLKTLGFNDFRKKLFLLSFFFAICVLANVLFVHRGITPLLYVNDNAITLEALVYGVVFALMLVSVIFWFNSFNEIMSSDKLIYLFSTAIPTTGLIISMILRFIPRFQRQLKKITDMNKIAGKPQQSNKLSIRLKSIFNSFSILLTWSFENSIDTADSMKARGYGLPKRTSFHLYKFEKRDLIVLIIMILVTIINVILYFVLNLRFYYYPEVARVSFSIPYLLAYFSYFMLLAIPLIIEFKEEIRWKSLLSKI